MNGELKTKDELVWVHMDGWAGRRVYAGKVLKRNPVRSRVYCSEWGKARLVPNHSLSPRLSEAAAAIYHGDIDGDFNY